MKKIRLSQKERYICRGQELTSPTLGLCRKKPSSSPREGSLLSTLEEILKGTSRAFYLSLSVLPGAARAPLSLAYLIARAADTIADAPGLPNEAKLHLLTEFRTHLMERHQVLELNLGTVQPDKPKERELLHALPRIDAVLQERPDWERQAIVEVVSTLVEGMIWDQGLFQNELDETGLGDPEFERYTYLVAGCVGPFWSRVCATSERGLGHLCESEGEHIAREFGKALQWVNILRDTPEDQELGRFYLPRIGSASFRPRFLAQSWRALQAFTTAAAYPTLFPPLSLRHRMAVFWPLVLGLRTLEKLFVAGGPRPGSRVKVSRQEVLAWVVLSPLLVATNWTLNRTLSSLLRRADRALQSLEES